MENDEITIVIKCNRKQARVLVNALDLFSRLLIGQIHELMWFFRFRMMKELDFEKEEDARIGLLNFKKMFFGDMSEHASYGICSDKAPEDSKVSYEMLKQVEHAISWYDNPKGGITVNFDKPLKLSKEKLIEVSIEEIKDETDN